MDADEPRNTLADQAATWVPPWEREPSAADEPATEQPPVRPEPDSEPEPDSAPEPALEPEPVPEPEPVSEPEPVPEREPALKPSSEPDAVAEPSSEPDAVGEPSPEPDAAAEPSLELAPEPEPAQLSIVDTASEPEPAPEPDPAHVRGALEAILLVVDEPVTEVVLAQALEQPTDTVSALLRELADEYTRTGRGFELRRIAGGWRLYTRGDFAPYVERFVLDGQQVRLTQAALETLAVVAYKQPVTRSRISAIRGVNCDGVVRTLVSRGLVEECGIEPETGAHLYRTTTMFLEKLGLDTVDELPPLAPFLPDDMDETADASPR